MSPNGVMSPFGPSCLLKSSPDGSPQRHLSSEISFLTTRNPALGSPLIPQKAMEIESCWATPWLLPYRRWDIKPKMWQIWKWVHHPMEEPPQKIGPHFCGQVWHWIRHFVEWLGSRNGPTWSFSTMNHPSEAENRLEKIGALGCCPHSPYQWLPWFTHFNESTGFEESTFTLGGRSEFAPIPCQPPNMKQEKWRIFTTQSRIPKSSAWIRLA